MSQQKKDACAESADSTGPVQSSLLARLARLGLGLLILWVVVYVLAPLPVEHFGPMQTFAKAARENNIHPGAVYYTDVPDSTAAEMHNRATVRFSSQQKERQ